MEALLSLKKVRATALYDERLSSYVKIVNYLLATYAAEDIIAHSVKKLEPYKQVLEISAVLYAKKLTTEKLRCGIVYKAKRVGSLCDEGLGELVCDNTGVYLRQHPRAPLAKLARSANRLIKIAGRNVRASESSIDRMTRTAVNPDKSYTHLVMASDNNNQ